MATFENAAPGHVFIFRNAGSAGFDLYRTFEGAYYPTRLVGVDLDGDGDLDLATSNHDSDNSGFVAIWQNKGNALFEMTSYGHAPNSGRTSICSHDFNGDGNFDLAAASGMANQLSVLFNRGNANFTDIQHFNASGYLVALVSADMDLDGDADIVMVRKDADDLALYLNYGGQFSLRNCIPVGTSPHSLTAADLDGDSNLDLAVASWKAHTVTILANDGQGNFNAVSQVAVPMHPNCLMVADLDGDGDMDIITCHSNLDSVHVLANQGAGKFVAAGSWPVGNQPNAIQIADLDNDQDLDIITTNGDYSGGSISVLRNIGQPIELKKPEPKIISIKDIDNDQGRHVRVTWRSSLYDDFNQTLSVTFYCLWRRVENWPDSQDHSRTFNNKSQSQTQPIPENSNLGIRSKWHDGVLWDFVAEITAERHDAYGFVAPTLVDSTRAGSHWSVFYVSAHTSNPDSFFCSEPDSGYSIDNLPPQVPAGLTAKREDSLVKLDWNSVIDPDFNYYAIYRSLQMDFCPDTCLPYATTLHTFFHDKNAGENLTFYYRISAFDFSGNESDYSVQVSVLATRLQQSAPGLTPTAYALAQNYPNPFNPVTHIIYQVPEPAEVVLKIFDLIGQEIKILVNVKKLSGTYTVAWDGKNERAEPVASGIYIYSLTANNFIQTKKMILMR